MLHTEAETRVRQADLSLKTTQAKSKHLISDLQGQLDQQVTARVGHHINRRSSMLLSHGRSLFGCHVKFSHYSVCFIVSFEHLFSLIFSSSSY